MNDQDNAAPAGSAGENIANVSPEVNTEFHSGPAPVGPGTSPELHHLFDLGNDPETTAPIEYDEAPPAPDPIALRKAERAAIEQAIADADADKEGSAAWCSRCDRFSDDNGKRMALALRARLLRAGVPLDPDGLKAHVEALDAAGIRALFRSDDEQWIENFTKLLRKAAGVKARTAPKEPLAPLEERIIRVQKKLGGVGQDKALKRQMAEQRRMIAREMLTAAYHGVRVITVHSMDTDGFCTCMFGQKKSHFTKYGTPMVRDKDHPACRKGSAAKHPHADNWVQNAYSDLDQVERLLLAQPYGPYINWGFAIGPDDNLCVFDFDGPEGVETYGRLVEEGRLPNTVVDVSGSGGYHAVLRVPAGWEIKNSVKAMPALPGVDMRGDGGYVACSGSRHEHGGTYAWLPGHSFADVPIADAPIELLRHAYFATKDGHSVAPDGTAAPADTVAGGWKPTAPETPEADTGDAADNPFLDAHRGLDERGSKHDGDTGFDAALARIGDDTAALQAGAYDTPIYAAFCAWFGERRAEVSTVDAAPCIEAVRARVVELGPRDGSKNSWEKYKDTEYLEKQASLARAFVQKKVEEAPQPDPCDTGCVLPECFSHASKNGVDRLMYTFPPTDAQKAAKMPGTTIEVCNAITLLGRVRDEKRNKWGKQIEYKDDGGVLHRTIVHDHDVVAGDASLIGRLAHEGLNPNPIAGKYLRMFLGGIRSDRHLICLSGPGWHNTANYISPLGDAFGPQRDVMILDAAQGVADREKSGDLEGWKTAADAACAVHANPFWKLGILLGFGGAIVDLTGLPTCGINWTGDTSSGKSTSQALQASVSTNPRMGKGIRHGLKTSTNSIENLITMGNGCSAAFDELALVDASKVSELIFGLAGGIDKARQQAAGGLRVQKTWATCFSLSGERTIRQMVVEDARQKKREGLTLRALDISTLGYRSCTPEEMKVIEGYQQNYGHALPVFIQWLIDHEYNEYPERLVREIEALTTRVCGKDASSKLRRAAVTLGLLWRVAEIVHECKLLASWAVPAGRFVDGTPRALQPEGGRPALFAQVWRDFLAGEGKSLNSADGGAVEAFLATLWARWADFAKIGTHLDQRTGRVLGWWDDEFIYLPIGNLTLMMPDIGLAEDALRKALGDAGVLVRDGRNLVWYHLPRALGEDGGRGHPHVRIARSRAPAEQITDDDDDGTPFRTAGRGLQGRRRR